MAHAEHVGYSLRTFLTRAKLHHSRLHQQRYGLPNEEWLGSSEMLDERKFTVGQVLGEQIKTFGYSYDFGDGWDHQITAEEQLAVQAGRNDWPMCLAAENACPPEDVGGPPGYMDFLQAMSDPQHAQQADYWRWWGGPFDPCAFCIKAANIAIRKLR